MIELLSLIGLCINAPIFVFMIVTCIVNKTWIVERNALIWYLTSVLLMIPHTIKNLLIDGDWLLFVTHMALVFGVSWKLKGLNKKEAE